MIVEKMKKRVMVADTDTGKELAAKITDSRSSWQCTAAASLKKNWSKIT